MPSSPDIIDWSLAARAGRFVAGGGPATTPGERKAVRDDFREFTYASDGMVRAFTGLAAADPEEPHVLGRGAWIAANVDGFRRLVGPLAEKMSATAPASAISRRLTGAAIGLQIGLLLGYMAQKVLGQYDLVLAAEDAGTGRVYYVGPNVVEMERRFGLPPRDFRLWIALHEVTHRSQFTGVPWLRARMRDLVARSIGSFDLDPERVKKVVARGKELLARGPSAWKTSSILDLMFSPEQRAVVDEVQALMTVVEGHGTFVMNRVGREQIPGFEDLHDVLERRRSSAGGAEKAFQRAIGLEMKFSQYRLGEQFMDEVADRAGLDAVNKVWEREENLPTLADLRHPDEWLARVGA